jgi:hypothetical protein
MKKLLVIAFLGLLCSCVAQNMNSGLTYLLGQDIRVAVSKIGYPNEKREMLGDRLYIWGVKNTETAIVPVLSGSTNGYIGTVSINTTTTSMVPITNTYYCSIELAVDSNNRITHYEWRGNMGGCASYANRLKPPQ